jgi:biopolymer transport protein ExbB/TolQ
MCPRRCRSRLESSDPAGRNGSRRGWLCLAGWAVGIAVVWLLILPRAVAWPRMAQRIEFFEQQRIDPSAMFYTDVEAMDDIRQRMDRRRQQDAWRFWRPMWLP